MRLSYANIMSTIAVFIALGGTSYAAVQIHGSQIKNRTITQKKLKNGSVGRKQIKGGAVGYDQLAYDSVTTTEIYPQTIRGKDLNKNLWECISQDRPSACSYAY